ncbi:MAG TPA: agmatinase family protein [Sphingomonas sp.]
MGKIALAALSLALASAGMVPVHAADPAAPAVIGALTPAQKAFIDDPETLKRFKLTRERLYTLLAAKDSGAAKATVDAMMRTVAAARYQPPAANAPPSREILDPTSDFAAVPLNPQAGDYNMATVLRPPILDRFHRDPGPFSLKRYMDETDGIPTFAGAPVAIRKEDLIAGKVDVAFVGVPLDLSSGWRDSQNAPGVMRAMYGTGGYDIYAGVDPAVELSLADYGDFSVDRMSPELGVAHVRKMIGEMLDAGVIPFIVGGDHSVSFPTVAAMTDHFGAGKIGIVQLDAHHDAKRDDAHYYSDQQVISRLLSTNLVDGKDIVQIGTRGGDDITADDLEWMRSQGIRYHTMAEVEDKGWQKVVATALDEIHAGPENVVLSFDISVLDPAYASGAGRPSPDGLTMREAVPLVRRICAETKVVGFEMLDVAPYLDLSYETALNANTIMHACLTGIAMRKAGIKDPAYLSPLTAGAR